MRPTRDIPDPPPKRRPQGKIPVTDDVFGGPMEPAHEIEFLTKWNEELRAKMDALQTEVDRLKAEVVRLKDELEREIDRNR
jgi:predicted nuclease with TOPRIM domain